MGFESYSIVLCPNENSPLRRNQTAETLQTLAAELQERWTEFQVDTVALAHLEYPQHSGEMFLIYESAAGLFQAQLRLNASAENAVNLSLRFAFCNPPSVYEPFFAVTEWLMQYYALYCEVMSNLAPEQADITDIIETPDALRAVLLPSIEYNRRLWQLDAGTNAEAILRPNEAIACFIAPHFLTTAEPVTTLSR